MERPSTFIVRYEVCWGIGDSFGGAGDWARAVWDKRIVISRVSLNNFSKNMSFIPGKVHHRQVDQGFTSRMTSSSTGEPSGRLATPKTRRDEIVPSPKTSRSSSDAASATLGWSVNSGVAAT